MKFSINCADLQEGLSISTRALAVRPAQKILEGVLIQCNANNDVILTCIDQKLSIRTVYHADVEEPGTTVLPGRFFTELIRKMPLSDISISSGENDRVNIRCMSSNSTLSGSDSMEFPQMPNLISNVSFRIAQNKFRDMISKTVFATSTDENRQTFTGCLLELTEHEIRLVALDGFRIAVQILNQYTQLPDDRTIVRAIVPGKVLTELSRILQDTETECSISLNDKQIKFEFSNIEVVSVLLTGEYIDYRKMIPTSFKTTIAVNRMKYLEAMDRASLLAKEGKNNTIRMKIDSDHIKLTSHAEVGDVVEYIDIQLEGDPLEIAFNSKYISDIIRNIPDDFISMNFNTNVSPCVIRGNESNDYLYMVLPMRVN